MSLLHGVASLQSVNSQGEGGAGQRGRDTGEHSAVVPEQTGSPLTGGTAERRWKGAGKEVAGRTMYISTYVEYDNM